MPVKGADPFMRIVHTFLPSCLLSLFGHDCLPLDRTIWAKLVPAMSNAKQRNRQELIQRIEGSWHKMLDEEYVIKTCKRATATRRLHHVVAADSSYIHAVHLVHLGVR